MNTQEQPSIGQLLKSLRLNKGWILRELSDKTGLDPTLLSKIERAERLPTKEQIKIFCKVYRGKKEVIMLAYLSDKILQELENEKLALQAMVVAEEKIKYGKMR